MKENTPMSSAPPAGGPPASTPAPAAQQQQLECDDSDSPSLYYNFARVTGTPEEVILDFGLNPNPMGVPSKPIKVSQKMVTNYFTAKRLLMALQMTVQRHEAAFGVLEMDINKRVRAQGR
jgi:hypothetical protein